LDGNSYIKLLPSSVKQTITTDELLELFHYYKSITAKTGHQLSWGYDNAAFPYEIKEKEEGKGKWFYLKSNRDGYHLILLGIDKEEIEEADGSLREQCFIQVTIPEGSTAGDKGKANEFCKFLAKKLKGELHLFNGRIMYFYPRK
jgi:hypothetical protein